jgi:2-polyprenyl-3-methyl-5-hydroxy-6-metoxy-1,4-benzoquinol methylase
MPEDMGHFRRNLEKRRFDLISRLVPGADVSDILDLGCGSGWLSEMLQSRGFRVTALDLGFDSIRRASVRLKERSAGVSFTLGDIYHLPFGESNFDAVVASEVLEHLDDPQAALHEMARVVRPGGCLAVTTPYRERIEETLCVHCNKKTPVNAHLHSFDEKNMERMLHEAGFTVQKCIMFINRPLERLGMAGMTFFLPYMFWRLLDTAACGFLGRESFMAVKALRRV